MADDLTAIPTDLYREMRDDLGAVKCLLWIVAVVLALLICTLVQKGVLTSWTDLFKPTGG